MSRIGNEGFGGWIFEIHYSDITYLLLYLPGQATPSVPFTRLLIHSQYHRPATGYAGDGCQKLSEMIQQAQANELMTSEPMN